MTSVVPLVSEPSTPLTIKAACVAWLLIGLALIALAFQQFTRFFIAAYAAKAPNEFVRFVKAIVSVSVGVRPGPAVDAT